MKKESIDCYTCPVCRNEFGFLEGTHRAHTPDACREKEIYTNREELKRGIDFWKDAWYEQRDATGRMAWTVPNPYYLQNCNSPFFQREWKSFVSFAQQLVRDGLIPLDDKPQEVIVRAYVDPFDNIEE